MFKNRICIDKKRIMKSILIIGGGFSGVATAIQLLRQAGNRPLYITLLNRSPFMARGLAYGTQSPEHTLNVPVGNMSALDDDPEHFLRYMKIRDPEVGAGSFVSRKSYGDYLEYLLTHTPLPPGTRLQRLTGRAIRIEYLGGQGRVTLDNGKTLGAHKIVLAFGNFHADHPYLEDMSFYDSTRYIGDPWDQRRLNAIGSDEPVLLLGTGLTAIDVTVSLLNRSSHRKIVAVSRRGLLPQRHRAHGGKPSGEDRAAAILGYANTVRTQLHAFRKYINAEAAVGGDWRDALTALRPATQKLWCAYPEVERRRFLRHLQPYWDSHRHRIPPATFDYFNSARETGVVQTQAARIISLVESKHGVEAVLRPRGNQGLTSVQVSKVINCTGPNSNLSTVNCALVQQLLKDGMIHPDRLCLGLDVGEHCEVLDATGRPSGFLYYIGPWLKASYWEATAVPELRRFARELATSLLI